MGDDVTCTTQMPARAEVTPICGRIRRMLRIAQLSNAHGVVRASYKGLGTCRLTSSRHPGQVDILTRHHISSSPR